MSAALPLLGLVASSDADAGAGADAAVSALADGCSKRCSTAVSVVSVAVWKLMACKRDHSDAVKRGAAEVDSVLCVDMVWTGCGAAEVRVGWSNRIVKLCMFSCLVGFQCLQPRIWGVSPKDAMERYQLKKASCRVSHGHVGAVLPVCLAAEQQQC